MRSSRSDEGTGAGAAGFTLLEMLVVLAVLGLIAGLVIARGPSRSPTLDVRAAAETVVASLRLARSRAVATNRPVTVALDLAGHAVRVGEAPPLRLPPGIALAADVAGIRFDPDGGSSGGRFALAAGRLRVDVEVGWLTGRVSQQAGASDAR